MAEANNLGYELDWDSEIEKDGVDFITLPAGEYNFVALTYERGRYTPKEGAKLPPCNMAIVDLEFDGGELGKCVVKHRLFLHSSTEGLLCAFFNAIGQRQHGERIKMNWNAVPMSRGRAKLKVRKYTKDGEDRTINEVEKFFDYDPSFMGAATPTQPTYAAPQGQQQYAPQQPQQPYAPPAQQQQPYYPPQGQQQQYAPPAQQTQAPQTPNGGYQAGRF